MATGYRTLNPNEIAALSLSREWAHANAIAPAQTTYSTDALGQRTPSGTISQFNALGLRFLRVSNNNSNRAFYSVWNHAGPLAVTGVSGPKGDVMMHVQHWPQSASRAARAGVGAAATLPNPQNRPEINAAIDLLAAFQNGCQRGSLPVVSAFQNAYNASGLPGQLSVDGEYGPNSQRALQNVMDEAQNDAGAGPSQQAPDNCYPEYGSVPSIPAVDVAPATPSSGSGTLVTPTTVVTGSTGPSKGALIIGGAVAAVAAGAGYMYWKKHHRRR